MLFPILSAVSESFALIVDKLNLKVKQIGGKTYTVILFILMSIVSLPLLYLFKIAGYTVSDNAFTFFPLLVMGLIILCSLVQNILYYVGLKNKDLSHLEPIRDSEPIFIILLAFIFFPVERSLLVFVLGIITTIAIIYSHMEKSETRRIKIIFDRYALIFLSSMFLAAIANIGYRYVLDYFTPLFLYFVRLFGIAILLALIFKPAASSIPKKQIKFLLLSAVLYSVSMLFKFFAISAIGLSLTVIILALSPSLIYLFSAVLLKEKLSLNKIISSIVIVGCVIVAVIFL